MSNLKLALDKDTPVEILTRLVSYPDPQVQYALAGNPSIPEPVMLVLTSAHLEARIRLVTNTSLTSPVATILASDSHHLVRQTLAFHQPLFPDAVTILASDSTSLVRQLLAANPTVPSLVLTNLASDPDMDVLVALVQNIRSAYKALYLTEPSCV